MNSSLAHIANSLLEASRKNDEALSQALTTAEEALAPIENFYRTLSSSSDFSLNDDMQKLSSIRPMSHGMRSIVHFLKGDLKSAKAAMIEAELSCVDLSRSEETQRRLHQLKTLATIFNADKTLFANQQEKTKKKE